MKNQHQRIVVLGDIHYCESYREHWDRAIEDINFLSPDLVLVAGDLTGGVITGTSEGMRIVVAMLDRFNAPWQTVIGNHDLEAKEFDTDAAAVESFLSFTNRKTPWFRKDLGPVTILGLSNTQWRDNPDNPNEIVFDDEQLEWCRSELASIPDRPVFILAHVPPIGSGLMTMAELHASIGSNAFANQNHIASKVMRLVRENPNVLMWFSGHNHLGQHYRDSISIRIGVHFIHAGVVGPARDGYRHSRVIDLFPDRLLINTFDHSLRRIDETLIHEEPHSLEVLLDYRRVICNRRFVPTDPAVMRQGPGPLTRNSKQYRFAFLYDAHMVNNVSPCQERVLEWTVRQMINYGVDAIVLGGDLTHHANSDQARKFIKAVKPANYPIWYLPGNNESTAIQLKTKDPPVQFVNKIKSPEGWPEHVFMLPATSRADTRDAVKALFKLLPADKTVLVLAHFDPESAGEETYSELKEKNVAVEWICGHPHRGKSYQEGAVTVHQCGGLDPIKARGHPPELLICDWDGEQLEIQRLRTPATVLQAAAGHLNPQGTAFQEQPADN